MIDIEKDDLSSEAQFEPQQQTDPRVGWKQNKINGHAKITA